MQSHEEWLLIGEAELKLAKKAIQGEDIIILPAAFLAQQAAEKALKAYLTSIACPFRKTHDLVLLLESCIEFDDEFNRLLAFASSLNPYITRCRYPDDCFSIPDLDTVQRCIEESEQIIKFVKLKMGK